MTLYLPDPKWTEYRPPITEEDTTTITYRVIISQGYIYITYFDDSKEKYKYGIIQIYRKIVQ